MHSPTPCITIILTDSDFKNLLIMLQKLLLTIISMSWGLNKNYLMKNFGIIFMGGAGPHTNPREKTREKPLGQKSLEKPTSLV